VSVTEVAPGIHRIESRLGSRRLAQWLVVGSEGSLLLDTGIAGTVTDQVAPALSDEVGIGAAEIVEVVLSHADVDHYGGDAEIRALAPDARLRAHALDRPLIESWQRIAGERYGWYRHHGLDYDPDTWAWLENAAGPDTPLDGELEPGERIDLGGVELEVLHLPGHSAGHVGLFDAASGTAIVSDAVMGRGFDTASGERAGPPPYVDLVAYRGTIELLRELSPARLGTAHFPPLEGEAVSEFLVQSRKLTDDLDAALDRELASGPRPISDLLPPAAAALGGYPEMEVELARSIGAHLDVRAATG
jgi:glyoxylase-like metal-dependent hydrolase (beta-lactamase superfamily II)